MVRNRSLIQRVIFKHGLRVQLGTKHRVGFQHCFGLNSKASNLEIRPCTLVHLQSCKLILSLSYNTTRLGLSETQEHDYCRNAWANEQHRIRFHFEYRIPKRKNSHLTTGRARHRPGYNSRHAFVVAVTVYTCGEHSQMLSITCAWFAQIDGCL